MDLQPLSHKSLDTELANSSGHASPLIVAIDGPAGAGKSTVAAHLARHFGLLNIETGAMYRALALKAIRLSLSFEDGDAIASLSFCTSIRLEPSASGNRVFLDEEDVTGLLRTPDVSSAASRVSVHPAVREWMVDEQRAMGLAAKSGVVMEGRDVGTVVFPNASVKIFLEASVQARSNRRLNQADAAAQGSRDRITTEIAERDSRDRNRAASPLRPAWDALVIDTTGMPLEAVLHRTTDLVRTAIEAKRLDHSERH